MDAITLIKENLDPIKILNYYDFENIKEYDDSIRACCKIHDGDNENAFVWNKNNNLWYCHTGDCGGGDVFNLIEKIDGISLTQAIHKAARILGLNIDNLQLVSQTTDLLKEQREWLKEHKKKTVVNKEYNLPFTKFYISHPNFSRFDKDILEFYNARFCNIYPLTDALLKNKLVIPLKDNDVIVGVALRDTTGTGTPKWIYQPKGIKTKQFLYNFDRAKEYNEIILTEGIFDVWAYHRIGCDNAVAVFGSNISEEQYHLLMRTNAEITLSFDNDVAGNKARKQAIELFKNKTILREVKLKEGYDPEDMKEDLLSAYIKREFIY